MSDMGFPQHIVLLLKAMYEEQRAAVNTSYSLTDWFKIGQGVRQGCILSPHPFNIYSELIMRNAQENFEGSVTVGGRPITKPSYVDDTVLIAGRMMDLQVSIGLELTAKEQDYFPSYVLERCKLFSIHPEFYLICLLPVSFQLTMHEGSF